ncbi:hypothetical protein DLM46_17580 [Paraburkholderia lacunae]|uniref:HNH endonuclease n=1 Tax=Paraburkholderia lacunae TaxID=2211104 RepID=A0A370N7Q9_9BURK|nr:hypothetical protein DLM46_17580 [Paraburkholderia lacunae]
MNARKTMPRKRDPRLEVRDWSKVPRHLKLSINLIPRPLHRRNLRVALGDRWRPFADKIKRERGPLCEICGAFPATASDCHAHEEWSYDEHAHPSVAKLERIAIVCSKCHSVEHFTNTGIRWREGKLSGEQFAAIRSHFYVVNGIDANELPWYLDYHYEHAQQIEQRRSMWLWRIDFGEFASMLSSVEIERMQPNAGTLR